ncbi:ATP-binding cassette domain-containing protein [Flavobacterium sufflavum]|uniref:ATP-binding cassette domain-containing protein n=1 Tax=Flavobacterium sufflavum TaxID=1921138 RepID=A0A3S2W8Z8_9FLAO|nr:ATP-binding cassette domain-containing protein [Flavobacterium sufflavum]RVT71732.1 ATP-binding cassette domain-containing protein [Flavobacterium sufflavum]
MTTATHWNILLSNQINKKDFIESILSGKANAELAPFKTLKGILFSDLAIDHFIQKEFQYLELTAVDSNRKLSTFSSGQRKKKFLKYCIDQNPDFIIFDNPMDHLDQASRVELSKSLEEMAAKIKIILLVNRTADLLPFISNNRQINSDAFVLENISHEAHENKIITQSGIPHPAHAIEYNQKVLIQMNNVSVSYEERPIVNNINWTIQQGEFWQLIGPNGSGKSTLLSLINGDSTKGYGQDLHLFGRKKGSGESVWDIKKNIGYFATNMTSLFTRNHTLEQMILSGFFDSIGLYDLPTTLQKKIADQWLELIGMKHLKNQMFKRLSVGQQRLAMIVRSVLKHPPLVILDEPVEGLDDENVAMVCQLINLLKQESNMTIVYVSHRIEPNLAPNSVFELIPSSEGSVGVIK